MEYIDSFCTLALNTYSPKQLLQLQSLDFHANNLPEDQQATLDNLLSQDHSTSDSPIFTLLGLKGNQEDLKRLNHLLLQSALVRDYLTERQHSHDSCGVRSVKQDLLRHLIDKKGAQHLSKLQSLSANPQNLQQAKIHKDLVVFPYHVDYLIEHRDQNEAIVLKTGRNEVNIEKQIQRVLGEGVKY